MMKYHLSFDTISYSADGKHPDVEIIDYQYGASGHFATTANREIVNSGETLRQDNVTITAPQMESIYFKWHILVSGEIFEERVDLTGSLPKEPKELYLHFIIRGSPLPDWLHFDARTLRLFGTPGAQDVGAIDLLLSAADEANAAAHTSFKMIISAINDAPVLANPVASISMVASVPNTYTLPANLFVDPDIGDKVVIKAALANGAALPDWLHFDDTSLTFTATPTAPQLSAPISLLISATDMSGFVTSTYIPLISAITGTDGNDTLVGTAYDDVIYGGLGNDTLNGTAGADKLIGGLGDDTYVVDRFDTLLENVNEGTDAVQSDVSWTLGSNFENLTLTGTAAINGTGNELNNSIMGNSAANVLVGGAGNDMLNGYADNDTYIFGRGYGSDYICDYDGTVGNIDTVQLGAGILSSDITVTRDASSLYLKINGTTDQLSLSNWFIADTYKVEQVKFADGTVWNSDTLTAKVNTSTPGNDYLAGTTGADTLQGGLGNDTYIINHTGDLALENPNEGTDTIYTSVSYTLNANVECLVLQGNAAITGTGNELNNSLYGINNSAANTLMGGLGNDSYYLDVNDIAVENADEGTDFVYTYANNYSLGANIENLYLWISGAGFLTGNDLNNNIVGSIGDDTLNGGAGDDTLNGMGGSDTMFGGLGSDTYTVDVLTDVVTENINEGTDLVNVAITTADGTYTLTANVENATLTGTVAYNLTGNELNNVLTGNAANNTLAGSAGNDTLNGLGGSDTMLGGLGDDVYTIDVLTDVVTENVNEGTDLVNVAIATYNGTYTLTANVENATLTGTATYNLAGNELNNVLTGNAANNMLNGGLGADILIGGLGNDTYVIDSAADIINEVSTLPTEIDLVQSGISYTLGNNLENLTLTGISAINGTGNTLNNTISGNAASNVLDGGEGIDTLAGGAGDDIYIVNLTATNTLQDIVSEVASGGVDTLRLRGGAALASYTTLILGTEIDNLDASATSTTLLHLTGNALNNVLTGNTANNTLNGGLGADTMIGGLGNDTYVIDNAADSINELANEGTDLVNVAIATADGTYVLAANIENATLTSTVAYMVLIRQGKAAQQMHIF